MLRDGEFRSLRLPGSKLPMNPEPDITRSLRTCELCATQSCTARWMRGAAVCSHDRCGVKFDGNERQNCQCCGATFCSRHIVMSQQLRICEECDTLGVPVHFCWEEDDDVGFCTGCKKKFTLLFRRHHCRFCGRIYCDLIARKINAKGLVVVRVAWQLTRVTHMAAI